MAPALRNFCVIAASVAGVYPAKLGEPPVVGMSLVLTLSFSSTGIPCSGPTNFPVLRRCSSSAAASSSALGFKKHHHIELWPRLVIGLNSLQIRLHQFWAASAPDMYAACTSLIAASSR